MPIPTSSIFTRPPATKGRRSNAATGARLLACLCRLGARGLLACRCDYCAQLARFLADPARARWTLKAAETHRRHVERSIAANRCDIKYVTAKRDSPHELVCTKNQVSYQRRVAQRAGDEEYVRRLVADGITRPA